MIIIGAICMVCLRSILPKLLPSARVESKSSTLGIGYLSKVETGFIICLKSPQMRTLVLSGLRSATMVAVLYQQVLKYPQ